MRFRWLNSWSYLPRNESGELMSAAFRRVCNTTFQRGAMCKESPRPSVIHLSIFLVLVATYLFVGLVGHDPWKQDEAYAFGIVYGLLSGAGDWVIPTLAGEPFMEKPPLLYWVAAAFARGLSPWLPLHDGARLAIGLFMAVTCGVTGWVARHWWGNGCGRAAVLALLGCLGLLMQAHMLLTDIPLMTGVAIAICGIALTSNRPIVGGIVLGTGTGLGFLAKGLIAPGVIGVTLVLLALFFQEWHHRNFFIGAAVGFLSALPWLLVWPIALYLRSPSLFMDWFWLNNIGRFVGFSTAKLGSETEAGFWWRTIPWFAFPALPLALITMWRFRTRVLNTPAIQVCLVLSCVMTAILCISASARANYVLPLLVPICLIAAPAALNLGRLPDACLHWTAKLICVPFAVFVWVVWVAMMLRGSPPDLPGLNRVLPLDFVATFKPFAFVVASVLTFLATVAIWLLRESRPRGLSSWVIGLALMWGLLSTLWLPWIDEAKSYRHTFSTISPLLGSFDGCVTSTGLGESERAMLYYVAGIVTKKHEGDSALNCAFWLREGIASSPPNDVDPHLWIRVWEGARSSDTRERFWLFRRKS